MNNQETITDINTPEEKSKREVFIYPSKISRRILCFLSDLIINLMVALLFFQGLAIPIAYTATNYASRNTENLYDNNYRTQILYDNNLLFFKEDKERFYFEKNLVTTSIKFSEYYVMGNSNIEVYDVAYNYFVNIKKESVEELNARIIKGAEKYFDTTAYNSNGTYSLKQTYKDMFRPNFIYDDELSKDGKKEFSNFSEQVFLKLYGSIIHDIKTNDLYSPLSKELKSYNYYDERLQKFDEYYHVLITVSSYVSFFLALIVMTFIVPIFTEKHQTVSEKIMRLERIDLNNFKYMSKLKTFEIGVIQTLPNLSILMFVPVATVGFNRMFVFSYLTSVSLIGVIAIALQLILVCTNKLNRTLKELATNSLVTDTEVVDEYYKELGYGE